MEERIQEIIEENGAKNAGKLRIFDNTLSIKREEIKASTFIQGVQVQSGPFISSIVFIPLVVRGCNIHFIIQKGGENDAQLLKL